VRETAVLLGRRARHAPAPVSGVAPHGASIRWPFLAGAEAALWALAMLCCDGTDPARASKARQQVVHGGTATLVPAIVRALGAAARPGESKRRVVESPWSQCTSECQRF
jgi:hypothetical protein